MIRVTLWGNRAFEFLYESVYDSQKQNPIVVLFVGCLPKDFKCLFQVLYIFPFVFFSCEDGWLYVVSKICFLLLPFSFLNRN
jgi:hypothetical protein